MSRQMLSAVSACPPNTQLAIHGFHQEPVQSSTAHAYPNNKTVAQLIAECAAAAPQAVALVAGSEQVTYGELDQQSNQLAHYLISLGVGRESIVALCLSRSIPAVVWSLAILKAGGAYLPIDPAYPTERIAFMLNDARPRVLITREATAEQLPSGFWRVVTIDRDEPLIENLSKSSCLTNATPDDLAYVVYTSGSTGRPKGVQVTHDSLLNLVFWHRLEFAVTAEDRASHLAGLGFDAAVWEVWPYLTAGASLNLPAECTRVSPELLRDWLIANRVTISFLPTALAERLITLAWPNHTELRLLLTGADTLHRYPTAELPFKLVNNYGPTECTVVATSGTVETATGGESLPTIGHPIANTQIYILDENLKPVP